MNFGYVFNGLSSQSLLVFLLKFLALVTVFALIAGVLTWIKDSYLKNKNTQESTQTVKNDLTLKYVTWILLAGFGLLFLVPLLKFVSNSLTGLFNQNMYILAGTLLFTAKLLGLILVVSLIMAAFHYIKSQYESGNLNFFKPNTSNPDEIHNQPSDLDNQSKEVITI